MISIPLKRKVKEHQIKVKKLEIKSLADYVKVIKTNQFLHPRFNLYRGQNVDKPLLPKIARNPVLEKQQLCDVETKMLKEFKLKARPYLDHNPQNDWEWLAIAQHHGLRTRLLDWTENALAGLWFCVENEPDDRSGSGVVWIIDAWLDFVFLIDIETETDPFKVTSTKILKAPYATRRIIAQSGLFTVHVLRDKDEICLPIERNKTYKDCLTKVIVPNECFRQIRGDLMECGINRATLFPDLDGMCSTLNNILTSSENPSRILKLISKEAKQALNTMDAKVLLKRVRKTE